MPACRSLYQLAGNANATTRFPDAAFQHIAYAEFASDLIDIDSLAFVGEARIAGDHEQRLEARQRRDDVLDHAVGEILLLRIAGHVLERQHGEGLSGSARGWTVSTGAFVDIAAEEEFASIRQRHARIGSAIFFSVCKPISSKAISTLPRIWRWASSEMQTPPGSAIPSRRAP